VLVKLPAGTSPKRAKALGLTGAATGFIPLAQASHVPMGSTFDTTHGQLGMTTAATVSGSLQDGHFSGGQFKVTQSRKNPLTTLSMGGGGLSGCGTRVPSGGSGKPSAAAARSSSRSLFSSVHGHFSTRGRNSSATVRGTQWTMKDTCAGTLTRVKQGSVVVRDFALRKSKVVTAGKSYFARALQKSRGRHPLH
jgi:hypothetical protein